MASSYPGGLDNFATTRADATTMATVHPGDHNDYAAAINAVEGELGTNPSGSYATVAARLAAAASAWVAGDLKQTAKALSLSGEQTVVNSSGTWLVCNGTAVSRTTWAALFAEIGTTYGVGNGSTTFNLPPLAGAVAVGQGTAGSFNTLGQAQGAVSASDSVSVSVSGNTGTTGAHTHTDSGTTGSTSTGGTVGSGGAHTHTYSGTTGNTGGTTGGPSGSYPGPTPGDSSGQFTGTDHTHSIPSHSHSFSGTSGSDGAHTHTFSGSSHTHTYSATTSSSGNHAHTFSGSGSDTVSVSTIQPSVTIGGWLIHTGT